MNEVRAAAGRHERIWDGRGDGERELPAGVYLYRLETEVGALSRRMVLLR